MNLIVSSIVVAKPVTLFQLAPMSRVSRGMKLKFIECVDERGNLMGITIERAEEKSRFLYYVPIGSILSVTYEDNGEGPNT